MAVWCGVDKVKCGVDKVWCGVAKVRFDVAKVWCGVAKVKLVLLRCGVA
jgi:hypothetical protein